MLLEPTPIDPRPDRRRLGAAAAAVAVVGVLVAVVALGVLDPSRPADVATEPDPTVASATPVVPATPTIEPATTADGGVAPPWSRFGLDPTSVTLALAEHAQSGDGGRPIVVRGWLSVRPERTDCLPAATSSAEACGREGILSAEPAPTLGWRAGNVIEVDASVDHLRPVFPPGLDLGGPDLPNPPPAGDGMAIAPHPVVMVGRFVTSGTEACRDGFLGCSDPFVVDQLIPITDTSGS